MAPLPLRMVLFDVGDEAALPCRPFLVAACVLEHRVEVGGLTVDQGVTQDAEAALAAVLVDDVDSAEVEVRWECPDELDEQLPASIVIGREPGHLAGDVARDVEPAGEASSVEGPAPL